MKPFALPPAPAVCPPARAIRRGDCVLPVDSDPMTRMLAAEALRERGWRVIEAAHGAEAMSLCTRERPQVTVLDATIVADIIAMANAMRLRTVAQGVQTAARMHSFSGQGCMQMQGFLFSRRPPPEEFVRLARGIGIAWAPVVTALRRPARAPQGARRCA